MSGVLQQYLCCALIMLLTGCASLPAVSPLGRDEQDVVLGQFREMIAQQVSCSCCFDADVAISLKKIVKAGTISGYLQSKDPSYVRFEGVNPLGMTEIVAGTDGEDFYLINVRQQKIYTGPVNAEKIQKYVPGQFPLETSQKWLIGHVPPGPFTISDVSRDTDGKGYWLDLTYENWQKRGLLLFDSREGVVLQNIMLDDTGDVQARFTYEYDTVLEDGKGRVGDEFSQCRYPKSAVVDENGNGTIRIQFKQIYFDVNFSESDFDMITPKGFEREVIR